jgi:hypothetical protein
MIIKDLGTPPERAGRLRILYPFQGLFLFSRGEI